MSTSFGVRSSLRSAAARRIEAAGRAFQETEQRNEGAGATVGSGPRILFLAPIEPTRLPAARRDLGRGQCRTIIDEVAAKYDVPARDILTDRRARVIIPARHEAMFRCVAETRLSLPAIGRIFNRDHSSIGHAVMRHHIRTGDPLPRGMDWKAGRRKRR